MTVDEIIQKFPANDIREAAERLRVSEELRRDLRGSRWNDTAFVFENTDYVIPPAYNERRPLAVTLHTCGLWVAPIYMLYNCGIKADKDYALHINEDDGGLRIYIDNAFDIILSGSYDLGFTLKIESSKNTNIIAVKE